MSKPSRPKRIRVWVIQYGDYTSPMWWWIRNNARNAARERNVQEPWVEPWVVAPYVARWVVRPAWLEIE